MQADRNLDRIFERVREGRASQGETALFYGEVRGLVARQIARHTHLLHEEREDLAQTAILELIQALAKGNFRAESSWRTYLYRIVAATISDFYRRQSRRPERLVWLDDFTAISDAPDWQHRLVDPAMRAEEAMIERERKQHLRAAIAELPEKMRRVLLLRIGGMKYQEIATQLGLALETVKSHLFHARGVLSERLADIEKLPLPHDRPPQTRR